MGREYDLGIRMEGVGSDGWRLGSEFVTTNKFTNSSLMLRYA